MKRFANWENQLDYLFCLFFLKFIQVNWDEVVKLLLENGAMFIKLTTV